MAQATARMRQQKSSTWSLVFARFWLPVLYIKINIGFAEHCPGKFGLAATTRKIEAVHSAGDGVWEQQDHTHSPLVTQSIALHMYPRIEVVLAASEFWFLFG